MIETLRARQRRDCNIAVGFHYFTFRKHSHQPFTECLSNLLKQAYLDSGQDFMPLPHSAAPPTSDELTAHLTAISASHKLVFLVVDGLDECSSSVSGQLEVATQLLDLVGANTKLRSLVSSRYDSTLASLFKRGAKVAELEVFAESNFLDIKNYLERSFSQDSRLKQMPEPVKSSVQNRLLKSSDGMFRYVACQLHELRALGVWRKKDIEDMLANVPTTLNGLYSQILAHIDHRHAVQARRALQWLCCTKEPLHFDELNEACIIDLDRLQPVNDEDRFLGAGIEKNPGLPGTDTGMDAGRFTF